MDTKPFHLTQLINTTRAPFRQSFLDYSHSAHADILDAAASSILLLSLTALILQLPTAIGGLSTRGLFIRSLIERSLLPDLFFAIKAVPHRRQEKKKYGSVFWSHLAAGALQLFLLVIEAIAVFSSTKEYRKASFEDLQLSKLEFRYCDESPVQLRSPIENHAFFDSAESLVIPAINIGLEVPISNAYPKKHNIEINAMKTSKEGGVMIEICTNRVKTVMFAVTFQNFDEDGEFVVLNMTSCLNSSSLFTGWVGKHVARKFNCTSEPNTIPNNYTFSAGVSIDNCTSGNDTEYEKAALHIILGSVQLSNKVLTRDDFFVKEHCTSNCTFKPGRLARTVNWDSFVEYQTNRIAGYWLWIGALFSFITNLVVGSLAPNVYLARSVAVTRQADLNRLPLHLQRHKEISQI